MNVSSLLGLRQACVEAWMEKEGVTLSEFNAAKQALERAETTMTYLDSLPD